MLKSSIKQIALFLIIVTVHFCIHTSSTQDTAERFPESFFVGKWGGYISGAIVDPDGGTFPFEIRLGGIPAEPESINPGEILRWWE